MTDVDTRFRPVWTAVCLVCSKANGWNSSYLTCKLFGLGQNWSKRKDMDYTNKYLLSSAITIQGTDHSPIQGLSFLIISIAAFIWNPICRKCAQWLTGEQRWRCSVCKAERYVRAKVGTKFWG